MNETIAADRRSKPPRKRRIRTVALAFLTGLLLTACGYWILTRQAARALRDAIAAADRLSPGWRLEEIEAARPSPRPNSALRVLDASDLLPPAWKREFGKPSTPEQQLEAALGSHTHDQCLTAEDVRSLKQTLSVVMPALDQARALADLPDGRYPITWSSDAVLIRRPHLDKVRDVATLLLFDALVRTQDGDVDGALSSCLAVVNAGRSVGDEGGSQGLRSYKAEQACTQIEYALEHGEAADSSLAMLQLQLDREAAQPRLRWVTMGRRAYMDRFFARVESGEITPKQIKSFGNLPLLTLGGVPDAFVIWLTATNSRAATLRHLTSAVEITKLPRDEQHVAWTRLDETVENLPRGAWIFAPQSFVQMARGFNDTQARLVCASAAIAVERFRLAHGRWPSALDELVPDLFTAVPTSPIDGKPLRFRRLSDGVSISAVDEGSNAKVTRLTGNERPEFRLWDLPHRHRPAKAAE